jgi:hypothetical protein
VNDPEVTASSSFSQPKNRTKTFPTSTDPYF